MKRDDFDRGIMNVLAQLSVVGNVTKKDFETRYDWLFPSHSDTYSIVVIVDRKKNLIIGTTTLLIERKFLRNTGIVSNL